MATSSPNQIPIMFLCLLSTIIFNSSSLVLCNSMLLHCDEKDESLLIKFKHAVTDPSGVLSSWSSHEKDCCRWRGVHCDNITRRVTELHLPCDTIQFDEILDKDNEKPHCLSGELDMFSLFDLEFLSYLDLSNNDFKTIKTCSNNNYSSNIHYLDLAYNYNLVNDHNNMLHQISHLCSSLQYLDLSGIDLYKEIDWLQSLTSLSSLLELHLDDCILQSINPSLQYANFTSLKVLSLSNNDFSSILPPWLFNLTRISYIDLSENNLHGQLPQSKPNLLSLETLCLYINNLDGPIPNWLGQLDQLKALNLACNNFVGPISTTLRNLSSLLVELHLRSNMFTGTVSEKNFHMLSKLKILSLGSESLIFDFDAKWIPSFQLQMLFLGYPGPKFPSWIYTQSSLELLYVENSRASFEPLGKFWKFTTQLEALVLINNSINSDISDVLLDSKVITMQQNNFSGSVPKVSPKVVHLDLSYNNLSDISPFLCQKMKKGKGNLETLFISDNALSGEIPNCLMDWTSLLQVNLGNNNLRGKIPHSIGSLFKLIFLSLEENKLSGEIPLSLKNCRNLRYLSLGENTFSGAIPSWIDQRIKIFQLGSNQFSGNIPIEICQFHSLKILDLSNNKLSGSIPNCLNNLTSLISPHASMDVFKVLSLTKYTKRGFTYLYFRVVTKYMVLHFVHSMLLIDLSSNNLSGTIPSELFMLVGLQSLNLSHNQFMGSIPQDIENLAALESLDLSSNLFSGQIPQSMSGMSFLEVLNLSCNNFEGKIPSGTQLQSFTNLSYVGNPKLCGPPLSRICPQDKKLPNGEQRTEADGDGDDDDNSEVHSWFLMGLGIGFATSFWGVLGVILFNRRFRDAYFRYLDEFHDIVIHKVKPIC
ncbi:hypothetical protein PIB30_034934 [Stylosanthes scabra]|uniref:Leucine-rich repeat-containing N-terminal plant-type domain-containing protein n=1 Tax=Stylosanthes scabra TaxID=79078 RepID=A0ABU6WGD9_9FABA|nr:hypothetical protein [Stylosanthes scabra]